MIRITIIGANSLIARNLMYYLNMRAMKEEVYTFFLYDYQDKSYDGYECYTQINVLKDNLSTKIEYDVDIIYIFTGITGTLKGFKDYEQYININEMALLHILTAYVENESSAKIVFPSSRLVYKGREGLLTEDSEKDARTIYAMNKLAGEQYLRIYNNVFGLKYLIFRICVPYGTMVEASSYGTIEFMLNKVKENEDITLYGQGEVRRTIIHIEDLCSILIDGAINDNMVNDTYNVGGEDYSLCEMADKLARKYNMGVKFVEWPDDAFAIESGNTVFDDAKLQNAMKYEYKNTFDKWISEI